MGHRVLPVVTLAALLLAGTCRKEGGDCHHTITWRNTSPDTVIFAFRANYPGQGCNLQGRRIASSGSFEDHNRVCWEDELHGDNKYEVYVLSTDGYNDPAIYYSCDSLEHRNTILAKRSLSSEDLLATDFVVAYP